MGKGLVKLKIMLLKTICTHCRWNKTINLVHRHSFKENDEKSQNKKIKIERKATLTKLHFDSQNSKEIHRTLKLNGYYDDWYENYDLGKSLVVDTCFYWLCLLLISK